MSPIYIDYSNTFVLLAGNSEYYDEPTLLPLQNIKSNIQLFHKTLLDSSVMGIPNENITISLNDSKKQLNRKLHQITEQTSKNAHTLIIYYAGYGVFSEAQNKFYLVNSDSNLRYLEDEAISLQSLKNKMAKSKAGNKILVIDALFRSVSGQNAVQTSAFSEFAYFDDVFVLTNSLDNADSYHDYFNPDRATFLTDKMIKSIYTGRENENPFLSTSDIATLIEDGFHSENLSPLPKIYGNAKTRDVLFSKNVLFDSDIDDSESEEDKAWLKAQEENTAFAFDDYIDKFPKGKYVALAIENLKKIEEDDESWFKARRKNLLFSYREYLYNYPNGVHSVEALKRIKTIKQKSRQQKFQQELDLALENTKKQILSDNDTVSKPKKKKRKQNLDLIDSFIKNERKISPSTQLNVSHEDLSQKASEETEQIITEQLAKLLVKQKNYKKAIEAYTILSKKNPEKQAFYKRTINELKKELR